MLAMLSTRPTVRRWAITSAAGLALLGAGLPAADGSEPDLSRFYHQKVAWAKCEGEEMPKDLQCGKVTVPLDYAKPRGGTLDLALARYRATGDSRGSVLLNFGGPGGAGVSELAAGGKDFMGLTNGYDVVSFDPRGVGRSSPVSCGGGTEGAGLVTDEDTDVTDDPRAVLEKVRRVAVSCAKHSGPVLPHIGTVNAARDLDVMRQALGDKKLNYLGFSYGSRLGAVYAAQFPKKVGRLVLDGVDTLTEPLSEQGVAGAAGQQTALEDFVNWCVKDIACPFGTDARSAREEVVRLVASLDEDPVPTDFGEDFTGQDLVGAIGQALYSKELWPSLERALASLVEDGDTRALLGFTGGASGFRESGFKAGTDTGTSTSTSATASATARSGGGLVDQEDVPLDNLPAALMAINCADDPDRPDADRITRDLGRLRAEYEEASPVFGRYRLTEYLMCYGRPKGTDFIREKVRDVPTPKMLLVGTRGDPATPYRWTVETAQRLGDSAVVLDNKGEGHTGYASSRCVHRKVDAFLLYGSLPPDGSSCGPETDRD
jgi:pimeloyl-ACP methyl ester carboxylesterase